MNGVDWSQEDYEARKQRVMDARASDDDRRLVKMYEQQGFFRGRVVPADPEPFDGGDPPTGVPNDDDDRPLPRPPVNADRDAWVTFAQAFNLRCEPDDQPITDPEQATKKDLVEAYKLFGEPAA